MKLCILGGGGFRTPYVYQALLRDGGTPRITEVALYDIDEGRLRSMTTILEQFAVGFDDAPKLVPTTSLRSAIEGSDFVFAAIRVGGLEGRRCDEHVALDRGVIGQETTGPGGLAYAIRTVPVMMEVARLVQELAPQAYLMNFTNPAGIITEAMQSVLGGQTPIFHMVLPVVAPHIRSGAIRPLAVAAVKRTAYFPDIPTIGEAGFPGHEVGFWMGVFASAGTPQPVVNQLNKAMNAGSRCGRSLSEA